MSSEARKQRQKQLKQEQKKNQQKIQSETNLPKSNKQKKPDRIDIENIPFLGNLNVKNTAVNRMIQTLFKAANEGKDFYEDYFYSSRIDDLKKLGQGLETKITGKGTFSQQQRYQILWGNAFDFMKSIDFSKIDKNNKEETLKQLLAQLLLRATQRARENAKKDLGDTDSGGLNGPGNLDTNDSGECK